VVAGLGLRAWQYLANNSLFVDEAALARNIIDRPVRGLFAGLDYAQSAPLGFLLVEKAAAAVLGTSEYGLRAFPLTCGVAALFLFWSVARRILTGWTETFAVGLFSLGVPFIYFSSLVKQYSSDVAVAILMLLASIEIRQRGVTRGRAWLLGALGAAAVWFSQPALFVVAGIGLAFLALSWSERDYTARRALIGTWILWGASSIASGVWALQNVTAADRAFYRWIWSEGFMPMPPQSASDAAWLFRKLLWAFGTFGSGMGQMHGGLGYRWSLVFLLVMIVGFWALWKTRRDVALFLTLPLVIAVIASALNLYPFTARLLAFLLPGLLLATAAGAGYLFARIPPRVSFLAPAGLAILGGAPIYAAATNLPPFWLQHVRPVIEQVYAQRLPGDGVYVYYGGGQAFHYYAKRLHLPIEAAAMGQCHRDPRQYLRDLDRFRGRRLWVIVTSAWYDGTEEALMLAYLDTIGRRVETIAVPGSRGYVVEGANGYLYDLTDASRQRSAESGTFPIDLGRVIDPTRPFRCYGISQTEPARR
jgi:hypothetical protein